MLLDRLAVAARERPDEPWLFFRPGLDWRWQSWARVADRVARAAGAWSAEGSSPGEPALVLPPTLRPEERIAAILAAEALGWPVRSADPSGEPSGPATDATHNRFQRGSASHVLPAARGYLDREPLQPVDPWVRCTDSEVSAPEQVRSAETHEIETQQTGPLNGSRRPLLFVQSELLVEANRLRDFTDLSLKMDAAWILEPQIDALAATVLWARPTHIVVRADGLATLQEEWTASAAKNSRLCEVTLWGDGELDAGTASRLGVDSIRRAGVGQA